MTFGTALKILRLENNLTQKELGNKLGLAESTISLYESDKRSPDNEILRKLADFFGVSIDYLLGRSDDRSTNKTPGLENEEPKSLMDKYILKVYYKIKSDALNGDPAAVKKLAELDKILEMNETKDGK